MKLHLILVSTTALAIAPGLAPLTTHAAAATNFTASTKNGVTHSKPYAMYMGANFSIEWQGRLHPVQDVEGSAFVIEVNGKEVRVPVSMTNLKIKMDDVLKVSPNHADVANFKADRVYTLDADPRRKYDQAIQNAMGASAVSDLGNANVNLLEAQKGIATYSINEAAKANITGGEVYLAKVDQDIAQANIGLRDSYFAQQNSINTAADAGARVAEELARQLYDAFELTFDISAPKPLRHPYLVAVTRYLEKADQPGSGRIWVYAQALDRVSTIPDKFRMVRGGFPPGFKLQDVQIHLYDGKTEIATNVARKHVDLTEEEALQFSIVDYVQQHSGKTVAAHAVQDLVPYGLRARLQAEPRPLFVKVGKNGIPSGVFADEACQEKVRDSQLESAVLRLRFMPALNKGKPVEAVTPVQLDGPAT